jgi:hypothetical protein
MPFGPADHTGSLAPEQRAKLMEAASNCPVHRALKSTVLDQIGALAVVVAARRRLTITAQRYF